MEAIRFEDVSFSYAGSDRQILSNLNLTLPQSAFALLIGASGCGKSTLLRQCKNSLAPHGRLQGHVYVLGEESAQMDDEKNARLVGFVHQDADSQIVTERVWQELAFGLESLGYENNLIRRRVGEMTSFFGIQSWFRRKTDTLSGGQKQLLNLASIMVMQPELILLDEPTAQLDPIAAVDFIRTLHRINREFGTTILLSEHRLEAIFPLVDTVFVMDDGAIALSGDPKDVAKSIIANQKHASLLASLPSAARIAAGSHRVTGDIPLSVRDGRLWLGQQVGESQNGQRQVSEVYAQNEQITHETNENHTSMISMEPETSWQKSDILLSVKDVYFRYQRDGEDYLRGLNLQIPTGKCVALLGGNGTGKSTLLKVIAGHLKPYRGHVKETQKTLNEKLSMLPQDPKALFTEITVEEEMLEALFGHDLSVDEKVKAAENMLKEMELSHVTKTHPYDLSGGEQQRLALGKILLQHPKLLLLDEPTKGLDPAFKNKLAKILETLKSNGLTILMVSHDVEFCATFADLCGLFFDGEILAMDTPQRFFAGNRFYTTAANRIARDYFPKAVLCEEVCACVQAL